MDTDDEYGKVMSDSGSESEELNSTTSSRDLSASTDLSSDTMSESEDTRHLKIEVYRGPQTAVSGLRFVVCGMPPSCIKNRVITIMCFHAAILDFNVVQQLSFKPCKKQNFCLLNIKIHMK